MQKKLDEFEAELSKKNDQMLELMALVKRSVETKAPVELKARLEPAANSPLQGIEQFAPVVSAAIASIAAVIALIAYWANIRSSSKAHIHGVFRDYLKLRFDYHLKIQENIAKQQLWTDVPLNSAGETIPQQLAGIELYALEEMYLWINTRASKLRSKLFPSQKDLLEAWENTIKFHLRLYPEDAVANIVNFSECYSLAFLNFVARVLNSPELIQIVQAHNAQFKGHKRRSPGKAELHLTGDGTPAALPSSGSGFSKRNH